jgi:hypothetical protein
VTGSLDAVTKVSAVRRCYASRPGPRAATRLAIALRVRVRTPRVAGFCHLGMNSRKGAARSFRSVAFAETLGGLGVCSSLSFDQQEIRRLLVVSEINSLELFEKEMAILWLRDVLNREPFLPQNGVNSDEVRAQKHDHPLNPRLLITWSSSP